MGQFRHTILDTTTASEVRPSPSNILSRRAFTHDLLSRGSRSLFAAAGVSTLLSAGGCVPQSRAKFQPDLVWGRRGFSDGRLLKPRAMAIDRLDQLYIVDMMGRIQVFDIDGNYVRGWRTPIITQGKPTGLAFANDGALLVADTHYFRMLVYSPFGELDGARTIGGENGDEPGQFHFVTDVAQAANGHYFIGQYGQIDRIQEFAPDGQFIRRWGSQGSEPEQFSRPQALLFDQQGLLWVADACNHRIQVFDVSGSTPRLERIWGTCGSLPGELNCPYGMDFDHEGNLLVAEFGNHRVQRFTRDGQSLDMWGQAGSGPGLFNRPWALITDSKSNVHVLDTENHRVQRFRHLG
ncbi:MAG: SMP-30/gluconolactonase/LRE family protein [Planctomycetales bacterium]|nr:SMP-30/gluconolactonase/LRE family protein [Planctomycetales bacterium]